MNEHQIFYPTLSQNYTALNNFLAIQKMQNPGLCRAQEKSEKPQLYHTDQPLELDTV